MNAWTPPVVVGFSERTTDAHLFDRLGIEPITSATNTQWMLTRSLTDPRLSLSRPDKVSLCIDFTSGKARHRISESGMGAQALSKAMGIKKYVKTQNTYPCLIDATGGLGQDAWALASLGCKVVMYERHPLVHALLADALLRASLDEQAAPIAERVNLQMADATHALRSQSTQVHAIYLDPMYPERRKKANSKKGMQFLHELLGPPSTTQNTALLLAALASGAARVAVKRPAGAPLLDGSDTFTGQRTEITTPNTRYDIYHCKG